MKIEIFLERETYFGDPKVRCTIDENAAFFDGNSSDYISAELGVTPGFHELLITQYGKQEQDHVLEDGKIVIDKYIEIKRIIIDDIEFKIEELRQGHFYPVYNENYVQDCLEQGIILPPSISPNLYLGHNGTWKLSFHTPFIDYIINKRKDLSVQLDNSIFQSDAELMQQAKEWFKSAPDMVWKV